MSTTTVRLHQQREPFGAIALVESGWIPDRLVRAGIRRLCAARLREESRDGMEATDARQAALLATLRQSPLAVHTDLANAQHYELPTAFFQHCLGPRLKYSCCYFERTDSTLADAEEAMLRLYATRAELADGQDILELGCGWGSLTLWMAERYPNARITGVSNSRSQREFIMAAAAQRGLGNIEIITCDVNQLELRAQAFDRVVSIEMFEHVRNYAVLLNSIVGWLRPQGRLFVHIFCHRALAYPFERDGEDDWMGRYFFSGGLMPAQDTLLRFADDLSIEQTWRVPGTHYQRTADAWLARQDRARDRLLPLFEAVYGDDARRWWQRWRMFWMACAELFGYDGGYEWLVGHYRFRKAD